MQARAIEALATPISRHVWETRYRWTEDGAPRDADIAATWRRVARAAAAVEGQQASRWEQAFFSILEGFRFLPAGRILAGAGTGRRVTLFNCFVMGPIEDDMGGIFDALKEGALTMQAGGGVGYDFSTLRPRGTATRSSGRIASGPVPFLQIWDAMCATLLSTGARRGAMIASLRCDHPDIAEFIAAKRQAGSLPHFNLSVQVSDAFMQAVERDDDWPLVFPEAALPRAKHSQSVPRLWPGSSSPVVCRVMGQVRARELWRQIIQSAWDTAEPGVLFTDRINQMNNLAYRENISTTNPCGEIPLPPYGACNLGSLNLVSFVREPFTAKARLDLEAIEATTRVAVRLLDNVIDCSEFPLPQQAEQARGSRRIGLGITGLGDALILLGLHYASAEARAAAVSAMQTITHAAYRASIALACEKGAFPFLERAAFLGSAFLQGMPEDVLQGIARSGLRNSHLTAIAPAGTISLLAGNVSSGIEPVFALRARRTVLGRDGVASEFEVEDAALRRWRELGHDPDRLPPGFVEARSLAPIAHLEMQAALQPLVDNAISKTVNVPADCPLEQFQEIYRYAHQHGLKGCTAFRPNALRPGILSAGGEAGAERAIAAQQADVHCCPIERQGD